MKKLKFTLFSCLIIFFFSTLGLMCPADNPYVYKPLDDLKKEVEQLTIQLNEKKAERDKLKNEITVKDSQITTFNAQTDEVRKRCP